MIRLFLLLLQGFACLIATAQVNWSSKPASFQLYPRNLTNNRATVNIGGSVVAPGFTAVILRVSQNGRSYISQSGFLSYTSGSAPFKFDIVLPAGKYNYDILVSLDSVGFQKTVLYAKRVVVGDAFLITGQSNSVANAYVGLANPLYRDSFVRGFGNSGATIPGVADSNWYIADGDALYNVGAIGQWGLILGKRIIDSIGMPVCFINAGVGGTPIGFHQKNYSNPTDIATNYGRMLVRARRAGLADKIRAIYWFQGESDGANAVGHDTLFRKMYKDWLLDYKAVEKVYPIQVRSGCGAPSLILRDKQRMLKTLQKCTVLTGNGLNAHDGCHYGLSNGYENLGWYLFNIVKTDLYKFKRNENHYSPEPLNAWYANSDQTLICLEMINQGAVFTVDTLFHQLFKLEGGTSRITNGWINKNKIYLKLDKSDCALKGLSYDGLPGDRPWVRTIAGPAMLSFYNHPILKTAPLASLTACKESFIRLGGDSIVGNTYEWKGMLSGKEYSTAKPIHKVLISEKYRLVVTFGNSGCNKDTVWQNVIADTVSAVELPDTIRLCLGDTIAIGQKRNDWGVSKWYKNGNLEWVGFQVKVFEKGSWLQSVTGLKGCRTEDSVFVLTEKRYRDILSATLNRCPGDSLSIHSKFKGRIYEWNGIISSDSFRVTPDVFNLAIVVSDSNGCRWHDSATIVNYVPIDLAMNKNHSFCQGNSASIELPHTHSNYVYEGKWVSNPLKLYDTGTINLSAKDKQGCIVEQKLTIKKLPQPEIKVRDTGFCNGDFIEISAPKNFKSYNWSHGYSGQSAVFIKSGKYWLEVEDSNQCKNRDSFSILVSEKPVWQLSTDTLICVGDSIEIQPYEQGTRWFWKGKECTGSNFKIKSAGRYDFLAQNSLYCKVHHQYSVRSVICQSALNSVRKSNIIIRTTGNKLHIQADKMDLSEVQIFDATGRIVLSTKCRGNVFETELSKVSDRVLFLIVSYRQASGLLYRETKKIVLNYE